MFTAIQQTSASRAAPTAPLIPPQGRCYREMATDHAPGREAEEPGILRCHCGRVIPTTARVVGFFHIVDGYVGAMQNCTCHATKSRALWTVTARGFVRRPWGGA